MNSNAPTLKSASNLSVTETEVDESYTPPIPDKKGVRAYRWLRWNFGSVYRRIFVLVFLANAATLVALGVLSTVNNTRQLTYEICATATSANILASLVARNEHFVNIIFSLFGSMPKKAPLGLRRVLAKVYSYGGIHSGCGVSATFWFVAYLALVTANYLETEVTPIRLSVLAVSYIIVALLIVILVLAHPRLRAKWHDWFENTHRYLGWSIVLLFWALVLLLDGDTSLRHNRPMGIVVVSDPSFWMLLVTTILVVYPWLNLRLHDVEAVVHSSHVLELKFKHANVNYGQAVRLSDSPLKETHAFAVIPNVAPATASDLEKGVTTASSAQGFSVIISNAGDWTNKMIKNPPKKIWVRGLPQYGVLRVAGLFKPVVIIATGSGIGPCLSLFVQAPEHPVRIIWSARAPKETYGQGVIDTVRRADPNALILDTNKYGRPDLVSLAYRMWEGQGTNADGFVSKSTQCEAVVIISNQKVTKKVVYGLESRGVPAYGAIFDS